MKLSETQTKALYVTGAVFAIGWAAFALESCGQSDIEIDLRKAQNECFKKEGVVSFKGFKHDPKTQIATVITGDKAAGVVITTYDWSKQTMIDQTTSKPKDVKKPYAPETVLSAVGKCGLALK